MHFSPQGQRASLSLPALPNAPRHSSSISPPSKCLFSMAGLAERAITSSPLVTLQLRTLSNQLPSTLLSSPLLRSARWFGRRE
nr:hypothetical protein Iba_chr13cCG5130 [Ipomoea batatas]